MLLLKLIKFFHNLMKYEHTSVVHIVVLTLHHNLRLTLESDSYFLSIFTPKLVPLSQACPIYICTGFFQFSSLKYVSSLMNWIFSPPFTLFIKRLTQKPEKVNKVPLLSGTLTFSGRGWAIRFDTQQNSPKGVDFHQMKRS